MGLLRSEEMGLYELKIPREAAYDIVSQLGNFGYMQFIDSYEEETPGFARHFHNYIKRCDDTLVKLHEIENEIHKFDLDIQKCGDYRVFLKNLQIALSRYDAQKVYFDDLEYQIEKQQIYMQQLLNNFDDAVSKRNTFIEHRAVLTQAYGIYYKTNQQNQEQGRTLLNCIAGTIDIGDADRFNRTLFRQTRANCLCFIEEINPDLNKNQQLLNGKTRQVIRKSTFVIMFQSGQSNGSLKKIILRVCDIFSANVFEVPPSLQEQGRHLSEVEKNIKDTNSLVGITEDEIEAFFKRFTQLDRENDQQEQAHYSTIERMKMFCIREKLIYTQMNLLNPKNSVYVGYIWLERAKETETIKQINVLSKANPNMALASMHAVDPSVYNIPAPTFNRINDFTFPAQEITNTYGIPRYQEANPALFAYMTFPFLFAVMFGDIGHGTILFIFANYLLFVKPNKANPGPFDDVFKHRYLLWFMGFFAIYCGGLYNDFFGMQLNLFGSCYSTTTMMKDKDCTYVFGVDPVWGISSNKLATYNSLKMKLSVILGVSQMTLGIFLKAANSIFFGNALDFFFEFIPQLVFLSCTFGYMCFMIFMKWMVDWDGMTDKAPSILTNMLKFFLNFGATDPNTAELYDGQAQIQFYLLVAALIAVPLMLLPKPLILNSRHAKKDQNQQQQQQNGQYVQFQDEELQQQNDEPQKVKICPYRAQEKPFSFSEEFVHQIIETIEFVLGCISHTASYLRLWALSLAHSQLAEVFFHKSMSAGLVEGNPIAIVIGYMVFALVTFGVLMCMDQMECFLHTLRLHWVEFQSKFFKADGHKFQPFCYIKTLEENASG